jgi:hypothetical protein
MKYYNILDIYYKGRKEGNMLEIICRACGIIGLFFMCGGVLKKLNILFLISGVLLTIYSIYLGDVIFIILECVFVFITIFDMVKIRFKTKK